MQSPNAELWRRARRVGLMSCVLLLLLVGAAVSDLVARLPIVYVAIGFLLSVALRQAALMTNMLLWSWREVRWRLRGAATR
jgi:hypothetical protein